jgi:iron complex outermembrane receptor protein
VSAPAWPVALLLGATFTLAPTAQAGAPAAASLADLSLEQLREVVVTTVARRPERLEATAASVYVISADDIRRAGATTIPEALRLAPTLSVARADANQYAVSARGFNNVLANKMLVVIDGRPVYTPLFSGVFWEVQDVMLEDVERIEVVTGPSTALWGSNAVNGLIHIVTRNAAATAGALVSANWGDRERSAALRYGLDGGAGGNLRLYAKSYDRQDTHRADGRSVDDAAAGTQIGFRGDWALAQSTLTLQGDAYRSRIDQGASTRRLGGANLLGRWERTFADGSDMSVQAYVDRTTRDQPGAVIDKLDTVDLIAQYGFRPADAHRVLLGAGYRHARDDVTSFDAIALVPAVRTMGWGRVFAQDEIAVTPRLAVTLAASVETNPYTGAQLLPSVRLAYRPNAESTWWGAVSRAARAPSRVDRDYVQPARPPYLVAGGPDFVSEIAEVYELGYRAQPVPALSYSVTLFQHEHSRLRSLAPTAQGLQFQNGYQGRTRGVEAWARWRVTPAWRLDAGLSLLQQKLALSPGAIDVVGVQGLGNDPRQSWSLRSSVDLSARVGWDVSVRHVGELPAPRVPSYTAVDSRLAWRVAPRTEIALVVQNLFDPSHAEWGSPANRVELERSVLLQLRWQP